MTKFCNCQALGAFTIVFTCIGTKGKGKGCGSCEGCTREDCGECKFCQDKPKFGGPGRKKQRCVKKHCVKYSQSLARPISMGSTPATKVAKHILANSCTHFVHVQICFPSQPGEITVTSLPLHTTNPDIFLASIGRKRKSVLGDGNCFFRALSYILYGDQGHHQQLRVYLAEFVQLNANLFQPLVWEGTVENHVKSMLSVGTWATQVELSAVSTLFSVQVFSCTPHQQTKNYRWLVFDSLDTNLVYPKAGGLEYLRTKHTHFEFCNTMATHFDCVVDKDGRIPVDSPKVTEHHSHINLDID